MNTHSTEQIQEIAIDAILDLVNREVEDGAQLIKRLDAKYNYLSHEDINRVADAISDAMVSVKW